MLCVRVCVCVKASAYMRQVAIDDALEAGVNRSGIHINEQPYLTLRNADAEW